MIDQILTTVALPEFSPEAVAFLEIQRLASDPSFHRLFRIGRTGKLTEDENAKNLRRNEEHLRRWTEIIVTHNVVEFWLTYLRTTPVHEQARLPTVAEKIAALEEVRTR